VKQEEDDDKPRIVPRRPPARIGASPPTEEDKESFREFYRLAGQRHRAKVRAEMEELQARINKLDDDNDALRAEASKFRQRVHELVRSVKLAQPALSQPLSMSPLAGLPQSVGVFAVGSSAGYIG